MKRRLGAVFYFSDRGKDAAAVKLCKFSFEADPIAARLDHPALSAHLAQVKTCGLHCKPVPVAESYINRPIKFRRPAPNVVLD